jgi:hypothetical protein
VTGGGAADLAWLHEPVDDYLGSPTDTDYKAVGIDAQLDDLTIENALQRLRNFSTEAKKSIETTFEGAISVTGTVTEDTCWLLDHVFGSPSTAGGESSSPYTYTWSVETLRAQSARFFVGLDYLNGYAERVLKGVCFPQIEFDVSRGETITFTATGFFGDEELGTETTPGSEPTTTSDPFVFHGGSLSLDGTDQKKMDSATLSIQTGIRPQRGWERKPVDAVVGAEEHTLSPSKVIDSTDLLTTTYGNSTAPTTSANGVDSVPGELTAGNGSETLTFDMPRVTPNSLSWEQIGNAEEDKTESPELFVDAISATLETDTAEAL